MPHPPGGEQIRDQYERPEHTFDAVGTQTAAYDSFANDYRNEEDHDEGNADPKRETTPSRHAGTHIVGDWPQRFPWYDIVAPQEMHSIRIE